MKACPLMSLIIVHAKSIGLKREQLGDLYIYILEGKQVV